LRRGGGGRRREEGAVSWVASPPRRGGASGAAAAAAVGEVARVVDEAVDGRRRWGGSVRCGPTEELGRRRASRLATAATRGWDGSEPRRRPAAHRPCCKGTSFPGLNSFVRGTLRRKEQS
jgi:hypothetical protein